jgi:5-methylcytosine-specific restriction protein A
VWKHPGVLNIAALPEVGTGEPIPPEGLDSMDDLPGVDYSRFGSDGAARKLAMRSRVPRDPRVRALVLERAGGRCERVG